MKKSLSMAAVAEMATSAALMLAQQRVTKSPVKRHYSKLLFAALAVIPAALLAQNLAPTPRFAEQAELSKVEEWVLSQGTAESIAPELAAILGLGSDRLPVKLKSFRHARTVLISHLLSALTQSKRAS